MNSSSGPSSDYHTMTRRCMLRTASCDVLGMALAGRLLAGDVSAVNAAETDSLTPLNRFPRMVQHYFVARVRQAERQNLTAKAKLKTKGRKFPLPGMVERFDLPDCYLVLEGKKLRQIEPFGANAY